MPASGQSSGNGTKRNDGSSASGLPQTTMPWTRSTAPEEQEHVPTYPVLSLERSCSPPEEEEAAAAVVVYAVFNKIGMRTAPPTRCYRAPRTEYEIKCQYVLGIDVRRNKIISTASRDPRKLIMLGLHATEFSCGASLHCKDR